jgi:hypothetical protein
MISLYNKLCLLAVAGAVLCASHVPVATGFSMVSVSSRRQQPNSHARIRRHMGLYDEPLPPRPPSRKKPEERPYNRNDMYDDEDDEDNDELLASVNDAAPERLFFFKETGKEARNLLPPLSRRLTRGIDCYFEVTDEKVVNLVSQTSCHATDACWALEACRGDISEAWIRISTARRLLLQRQQNIDNIASQQDWDEDSYEIELEEEFEQRKLDRLQEAKKRHVQDFFRGEADEQWLPKANPKPVDDDPWFTG